MGNIEVYRDHGKENGNYYSILIFSQELGPIFSTPLYTTVPTGGRATGPSLLEVLRTLNLKHSK